MYSCYQFRPRKIRLNSDGTLKGGILTFISAWIDWSFVRLLVAPFYKVSDIITFRVLAFDSMLVEAWANFRGCENAGQAGHGCQQCPPLDQCKQVPYDLEAGVGHRRLKGNPNKTEPAFGYKTHVGVSFENDFKNYIAARKRGAKPLFHYNKRNERAEEESLHARGYNEVGWSYAPCGVVMHPNGYDEKEQRLKFICRKACPATLMKGKIIWIMRGQENYRHPENKLH